MLANVAAQMTREQAIALSTSNWWIGRPEPEVAEFQLTQHLLAMPFEEFHRVVEVALSRPVFTHEFARPGDLLAELHKETPPRDFGQILALVWDLVGRRIGE